MVLRTPKTPSTVRNASSSPGRWRPDRPSRKPTARTDRSCKKICSDTKLNRNLNFSDGYHWSRQSRRFARFSNRKRFKGIRGQRATLPVHRAGYYTTQGDVIKRIAEFVGQGQQQTLDNMIHRDPGQHGAVQQRREVMMEVQDPGHRPEGRVMQDPPEEQPLAGVCYPPSSRNVGVVAVAAPLLAHRRVHVENHVYHEEDHVAPPDDGIAQQVYPLIVAREELPLKSKALRQDSFRASNSDDLLNSTILFTL